VSRQARLNLAEIRDAVIAAVDAAVYVGTSYDRDYLDQFAREAPAVWIRAQRAIPLGNDTGATGRPLQRYSAEVLVTVVHGRYDPGTFNASANVDAIVEDVVDGLIFETLTGADTPLTLAGTTDGAQDDSFITVDLLFRTEIVYHG